MRARKCDNDPGPGSFAEYLHHTLSPRAWVLVRANEGEHVITCDQPLTLVPVGPIDGPIVRLDSPDTIVMFPVDRERALVGLGKGAVERRLVPRGVPAVNRATALQSHRHVFASAADFAWEDETGSIIGSREYLALGAPGPDPAVEHYPIPPRPR